MEEFEYKKSPAANRANNLNINNSKSNTANKKKQIRAKKNKRFQVDFTYADCGEVVNKTTSNKTADVLLHLYRRGQRGTTYKQAVDNDGLLNFSSYVSSLQNSHGLLISRDKKKVATKYGAETEVTLYRLETPITITFEGVRYV